MHDFVKEAAAAFAPGARLLATDPVGSGHIHESRIARVRDGAGEIALLLQRLNEHVFPDLHALQGNVERVTRHVGERLLERGALDLERRVLALVATRDGGTLWRDPAGRAWRAFRFVEGTRTTDVVESTAQAEALGHAFGEFLELLRGLESPPLAETIPHFHDLPHRVAALETAVAADPERRAAAARPEIALAQRESERLVADLESVGAHRLPTRVVHHDCKINNLLLDVETGEPLAVIDLDTVMPGSVLSDFGELVRSATCTAPEDETDLSRIDADPELFTALARGFLAGAGGREGLGSGAVEALHLAGPRQALENAVRFLTDHLEGDRYFRIHRPGHNLDRARAQLALTARLRAREDSLRSAVAAACAQPGGADASA